MNGLIIIKKEEGMTSQTVVNRVKRLLSEKKAGHTGTLDPMATGVLPVLLGRGVKASEFMLTSDKHYIATLLLGITTDTEDITGTVLTSCEDIPEVSDVEAAIDSFVGKYLQTPPMYSALKVKGQKLCDLAREGITVEREPREVEIYSIQHTRLCDREYLLDIRCSKGTYIRTLCADIGKRLSVGGVMKTLTRCEASGFTLDDAHTLSELEGMSEEERELCVLPVERVFSDCRRVILPPFFARLARAGQEIYLYKIGFDAHIGERLRLCDDSEFFAVGEVREFNGKAAIKPIRQF